MKSYRLITRSLLVITLVLAVASAFAAELKGSVSVSRNNSRQIDGAILHVGNQEYEIVMDENGKSLAQMYEHKDIKVSCSVDGKKITVETWEEIRNASAPEPAYKEPEPEPEPQDEPEEEPEEKEPTDDDEPKDDEPKDDEPKDEEPKDEPSDDEEPKDEEPKEESEY